MVVDIDQYIVSAQSWYQRGQSSTGATEVNTNKAVKRKHCQTYFEPGHAGLCGCYVLNFSSLSTQASITSTVRCTGSSRLDEVYINSVTSELCGCTRGDVKVKLLLFTGWLDDEIPLLSPPFCVPLRCM